MFSYGDITAWLRAYADAIAANKNHLTELDSAIGDADHGVNMDRGFQAVLAKLPPPSGVSPVSGDIGALLKAVGMTLVSTVGGASGPLYGTFFLQMGAALVGKTALTLEDWVAAFDSGVEGVIRRGKAATGDKTMIDTLVPALDAFRAAGAEGVSLAAALRRAEQAAHQGMLDTIPLVARKGRASYLGERSAGHQDPGATSAYLLLLAAAETLAGDSAG